MKKQLLTIEESLASIAKGEPVYQRWQDYRAMAKWASGAAGASGEQRLEFPATEASLVRGRLIMVPTGQAAPAQSHEADTVYLTVEGEVEITIDSANYALKPLDLISVPAGSSYSFSNHALVNALVCEISAKNDAAGRKPAAKQEANHMVWERYRRDFSWTLPLAEHWGYHRGSGPLIITDGLRGHTVRQPPGQSTPWHYAARDMLFMGIYNEVEFKAAGKEFPLGPLDFLLIPAGTPYTYTNYALAEVVFLSIGGKLPPGKKGTYFAEDPGWPIRADARKIEVIIDKAGDAKVVESSTAGA